jgi:hypothetical protein
MLCNAVSEKIVSAVDREFHEVYSIALRERIPGFSVVIVLYRKSGGTGALFVSVEQPPPILQRIFDEDKARLCAAGAVHTMTQDPEDVIALLKVLGAQPREKAP